MLSYDNQTANLPVWLKDAHALADPITPKYSQSNYADCGHGDYPNNRGNYETRQNKQARASQKMTTLLSDICATVLLDPLL